MKHVFALVATLALALAGCASSPPSTGNPPGGGDPNSTIISSPTELKTALGEKLGKSNRHDVERPESVKLAKDRLTIRWAINENLNDDLMSRGARSDAVDILEMVEGSTIDYDKVVLEGTFAMQDVKGNAAEDVVIRATYSFAELVGVNWENFNGENVWKIADKASVHREFQ